MVSRCDSSTSSNCLTSWIKMQEVKQSPDTGGTRECGWLVVSGLRHKGAMEWALETGESPVLVQTSSHADMIFNLFHRCNSRCGKVCRQPRLESRRWHRARCPASLCLHWSRCCARGGEVWPCAARLLQRAHTGNRPSQKESIVRVRYRFRSLLGGHKHGVRVKLSGGVVGTFTGAQTSDEWCPHLTKNNLETSSLALHGDRAMRPVCCAAPHWSSLCKQVDFGYLVKVRQLGSCALMRQVIILILARPPDETCKKK